MHYFLLKLHRELTIGVFRRKKKLFNVLETAESGLAETTCVLKGSFPLLKLHMLWKLGAEDLTLLCLVCFGVI